MLNIWPKSQRDRESSIDLFDDSSVASLVSNEFPCVFYEAEDSLKVLRVSGNVYDLIGIQRERIIGASGLFEEAVVPVDRALFQLKLGELNGTGITSLIHRLVDDRGRIVRVAHSMRKVTTDGQVIIRGNMLPLIVSDAVGVSVDVEFVRKFIHKLGNYFQALNLLLDSLRRKGSSLKDLVVVQETTENAIELTRTFSSYLEQPLLLTSVNLSELLKSVVQSRAPSCRAKQIDITFNAEGIGTDATIDGDDILLDLALGAILDNAIHASPSGGVIQVEISVPPAIPVNGLVRTIAVGVMGKNWGIPADQIEKMLEPFHTPMAGDGGITLSLACRYIEMYGGLSQIQSCDGTGTKFEIIFPVAPLATSGRK